MFGGGGPKGVAMRRVTTLLIITVLVVAAPAAHVLAHPPICDWAAPAFESDAVAGEVGAVIPVISSMSAATPSVGQRAVTLVRIVVDQIGARYAVCID